MKTKVLNTIGYGLAAVVATAASAQDVNSLGMNMIRIEPGEFVMGSEQGDWDEVPRRTVRITRPFHLSATQVTNAQYEEFDPEHNRMRGIHGLSVQDDEAVVQVSWQDAVDFCAWLSEREGKPYRLPTEAEWEYACRAGTETEFHTGDLLPEEFHKWQRDGAIPRRVSLAVAQTPPNPWGLYDMHGNVEEWCSDGYGPYESSDRTDPVGRARADFKVTRGGSHNTDVHFLRSANRGGTLPEDRHWMIGFRVVQAPPPDTEPLPDPPVPLHARDVDPTPHDWTHPDAENTPHFSGPTRYILIPPESDGPLYSQHNHCPALTWCPNGDLLAIWYSCRTEQGRELTILASRLRRGSDEWDPASPFWGAPDRNNHASALWNDGNGTLYHFNGLSAAGHLRTNLALVMRTSTDSGATWSPARLINPERGLPSQPVTTVFETSDGRILLPVDVSVDQQGSGSTALWASPDRGRTWDLLEGRITGIHAGVVQLQDDRLLAFGRYSVFERGRGWVGLDVPFMPQSISSDGGRSWETTDSVFPVIEQGQRMTLIRLREGPILFVSYTDSSQRRGDDAQGLVFQDSEGVPFAGYGIFAALSFDEGETWPVRKLVAPESQTRSETRGYLSLTQTPDGRIHLISSSQYYGFNLAWLMPDGTR